MKKKIIVTLAVCLFGSCVFAETNENKSKNAPNVNEQIANLKESIRKLNVDNYKKEAEDFMKKADYEAGKGHTSLADAYKACATAKNNIAEAYEQNNQELIDKANEEYYNTFANLKKVKKQFDEQMNDLKAKYQYIADKYKKLAEDYVAKAKEARDSGNKKLYFIYTDCANARSDIAEGVQDLIDGRCKYIKAVTSYNQITSNNNKMVLPKLVIPDNTAQMSERINTLMEQAQSYYQEAVAAVGKSEAQLALTYDQISNAMKNEAAGWGKVIAGEEKLKRAEQKLETYNAGDTAVKRQKK